MWNLRPAVRGKGTLGRRERDALLQLLTLRSLFTSERLCDGSIFVGNRSHDERYREVIR